jgi:hypothetical protein
MPIKYQKEIDNNPQSQVGNKFQYFAIREDKTDILLTAAVSPGDTSVNVSAGHGFTVTPGIKITLFDGEFYHQSSIKAVNTNEIVLFDPIELPFSVASTTVVRGSSELAANNSAGVDYQWNPVGRGATIPIDVNKIIITFECGGSVPDLGKFGAATALVNKMYIRKTSSPINTNLGVFSKNRDFRDYGAKVEFTDKAPAGTNGVIITFDVEEAFTQQERFKPNLNAFVLTCQDDMDITGIESMRVSILGSYTSGE